MTLAERNAFFKVGIAFCAISTFLIIAASFLVVPVYPVIEENTRRLLDFSYYAVHASLIMVVLFSLTGLFLIYSFFQQTSAPEIIYIAFFTISFSFEALRLVLPLYLFYEKFPLLYLLLSGRVLLFARFFGIFSLFAASVSAAGLEVQQSRNVILVILIAVLIITLGVPIDTEAWDTRLNISYGYSSMLRMIEIAIFFITVISFFIAVKIRGSMEYAYIGIGVMIALLGRSLLLRTDNWLYLVPGIIMLSFGTWFACSKLHKIHLWM